MTLGAACPLLAGIRCVGLVAGSGIALEALLDEILEDLPFPVLPGGAAAAVPGHAGRFLLGRAAGRDLVIQCGRRHLYEGLPLHQVTATVDALRDFGVQAVVLTNAVGALRPRMCPGELAAADLVRCWPFRRHRLPETLVPDFIVPGAEHIGPYRWMHGPCYETCAEIRALQALGDACVGMSVAPELHRCRELGLPTAVLSCVTNVCGSGAQLTHAAVLSAAQAASARLRSVLAQTLRL